MAEIWLEWGDDKLVMTDPGWCKAITEEATLPLPERDYDWLSRYSRHQADVDLAMGHVGLGSIDRDTPARKGLQEPTFRPTAVKCLHAFLGLELPAALLMRSSYGQPERLIAMRPYLQVEQWFDYGTVLRVHLVFEGLQLYANGHIGRPNFHCRPTDHGQIQSRAIDNSWWNCSFDGLTSPVVPVNRWAPRVRRTFYLSESHLLNDDGAILRKLPT